MPILHEIVFDFGEAPGPPPGVRIPTVDDPRWTEDFADDTDEMLLARMILGEAENQLREAKVGVGFTVLNRLEKQRMKERPMIQARDIILEGKQYDALWNPVTQPKVRDPLGGADEKRKQEWHESYEVARDLLKGVLTDPTSGATNLHSF